MRNLRSRLKLINILCMIFFLALTSCSPVVPEEATPVAAPSTATTPSVILTPTSIPLTPTFQTPRIEQKCAQFLEDSPSTIFDGTIVLRTYKQHEHSFIYYFDLKTSNQISIGRSGGEVAISPDGNKVAYWDSDLKSVIIADPVGIKIKIPDPGELLKPAGWLDDQRLMLDKYQRDSSFKAISISLVVLDVVTGDKEEWFHEYPNFNDFYNEVFWLPTSQLILNPKFKYLIYPAREDSLPVILWDINSQREVARIHNGDRDTTPQWSPDGTRFVISAPPKIETYKNIDDGLPYKGGSDLFLVSYTGQIERLTYFTVNEKSWQGAYSWSPDGQYIAFLLETGKYDYDYITSGELAVVNVKTGDITKYCVGGAPVWTLDGHYILISQTNDALESKAYLLDPQSGDAFLIADDAFALGGTIWSP